MGSIAATGDPRRWAMEPSGKIPGVIFAPEVNCYKCPIGHTYPRFGIACAEYIEHMVANESDVAAVIVEPVVGTNGVLIPPKEYMPRLRQICDAKGVLLIADEVMTGWCRTGKWFAMDLSAASAVLSGPNALSNNSPRTWAKTCGQAFRAAANNS